VAQDMNTCTLCWLLRAKEGEKRKPSRLVFDRLSVLISAETPAVLIQICRNFPESLNRNARAMLPLGHDHCLPNPFQFIVH
jgi:hypothetical protein